ncbi:MAG: succinyl-CoA synthetase subunit beta [Sulfitobacter sp.]|nr:succinyl-CoA synthetase subunit beta [Sulfitobacter sp.]
MRPAANITRALALGSGLGLTLALGAGEVQAGGIKATAKAAMELFANNCFSPFMTAEKAAKTFALSGTTHDFYDLDPFSSADPSPATGRAVTPGTDRRCEIAFPSNHAEKAAQAAAEGLAREGITTPAPLPATYTETETTTLLAARRLNPRRTAIVHVGTRNGPQGTETFMLVERLLPTNDQN